MKIIINRDLVEQALAALVGQRYTACGWRSDCDKAIIALRAALAEPTVKEPLQVESTVAEIATTQQQLDNKPPSDYRRGYWDGFAIGKREGHIEAEDALAEPVQKPVAWMYVNVDGECEQIEYEAPPDDPSITPLYTAPPQRKPLTDETLWEMWVESPSDVLRFACAIERAHGITGPEDKGG